MITIDEYTQLFFSIVLGMGLIFEMPILVFFLAFMGIMSAGVHDQAFPLLDSDHFHYCGHRYAHARHRKHVRFRCAHAGACMRLALAWRGWCIPSSARAREKQRKAERAGAMTGQENENSAMQFSAVEILRWFCWRAVVGCLDRDRQSRSECSRLPAATAPGAAAAQSSARQRPAAGVRRRPRHAVCERDCEVRPAPGRQRESQESRGLHRIRT